MDGGCDGSMYLNEIHFHEDVNKLRYADFSEELRKRCKCSKKKADVLGKMLISIVFDVADYDEFLFNRDKAVLWGAGEYMRGTDKNAKQIIEAINEILTDIFDKFDKKYYERFYVPSED